MTATERWASGPQAAPDPNVARYTFSCPDLPEAFAVGGFEGVEELNRPYRLSIRLVAEREGTDTTDLLGRDISLSIERGLTFQRLFYGVVDRVTILDDGQTLQTSIIVVVPALFALSRTQNSRIFQGKTTLEIVEAVLTESLLPYGREVDVASVDASRLVVHDYCVQYRETNLDFIHRLLEEDGIGYRFAQDGPERLLLFDDNRALERAPTMDGGPVRFGAVHGSWLGAEALLRLHVSAQRTSTSLTTRDHDWTRAMRQRVEGSAPVNGSGPNREHEVYEHGLERHLPSMRTPG